MEMYAVSTIGIFLISIMAYVLLSKGYDKNDIRVNVGRFLIPNIILCIAQNLIGKNIFSIYGAWAVAIGLSWIVLIPLLQYMSYHNQHSAVGGKRAICVEGSREINIGCYMLVLYFVAYNLYAPDNFIASIAMYLIFWCFMLVPVLYAMHYIVYKKIPAEAAVKALQETYWNETKEYIATYVGLSKLLVLLVTCIIITIVFLGVWSILDRNSISLNKLIILCAMLILLCISVKKAAVKLAIYGMWKSIRARRAKDLEYKSNARARKIHVRQSGRLSGTVIMVIGESASRDHMHIYHPEIKYSNTPWLERMAQEKNTIVFSNTYACYNQTADVLKRALTEMSQYNDIEFQNAASIIEIAKAIGYKTYWFSNQGSLAYDDCPEALIASLADVVRGNQDARNADYDHVMLKFLKQINPADDNFIVFHLKGSHGQYKMRYPHEWAKWPSDTEKSAYHNTILYTDEFLEKLYCMACEKLNLQIMLYFSDHGDNLQYGHHPEVRTPDTVRIPMFVTASKKYGNKFTQKIEAMHKHQGEYFSNDMIYNLMLGLLDVDCDRYNPKEDISSLDYAYNRNNVKTFLGDVIAADYDR